VLQRTRRLALCLRNSEPCEKCGLAGRLTGRLPLQSSAVTRDFAFIETAPGELLVGWGPFQHAPLRRVDRPAFFISDFFLSDPNPWRHPQTWETLPVAELAASLSDGPRPTVKWTPPALADFEVLFASARDGIERGDFDKIVPVLFEQGELSARGGLWRSLLAGVEKHPPALRLYGFAYHNRGLIGASPEVLFESAGRGYRTMALAGTRELERAGELLTDPKELLEHRMVVDDIVRRLAPFGTVQIGELGILPLPTIAHLATSIYFRESDDPRMSFSELVRRLHPTAALGVWPRTEAGERWLREADRNVKRRTFGAPFGLETPDHLALALVAIRNLQWEGTQIRVGAGAGILQQSQLEREFVEMAQKRQQVKALFGFGSGAAGATSTFTDIPTHP
jgi:isochorismate synthase EntC